VERPPAVRRVCLGWSGLSAQELKVLIQKSGNSHLTNIADTQLVGVLDGLGVLMSKDSDGLHKLNHQCFATAAKERYELSGTDVERIHQDLANFFMAEVAGVDERRPTKAEEAAETKPGSGAAKQPAKVQEMANESHTRAWMEVVCNQRKGKMYTELAQTLGNVNFIETMIQVA
jgi:hypothetical protein